MAPRRAKAEGRIDPSLGDVVAERAQAFFRTFEDAQADETVEAHRALLEATDELMRALARVMIELSRIDAPSEAFPAPSGSVTPSPRRRRSR
jgi:hypothetical protein